MACLVSLSVCCVHPKNEHRVTVLSVALGLDTVIGAAISTIALLGIFGIIPMSSSVSYALLGVGVTYTAIPIAFMITACKGTADCTRKIYLIGKETWSGSDQTTEAPLATATMGGVVSRGEKTTKKPYNPDVYVMRGLKKKPAGYRGGE